MAQCVRVRAVGQLKVFYAPFAILAFMIWSRRDLHLTHTHLQQRSDVT